jgi:hypothetical protein
LDKLLKILFRNRMAYRFNQTGINSDPFIDGQPVLMELLEEIVVDFDHRIFRHAATES